MTSDNQTYSEQGDAALLNEESTGTESCCPPSLDEGALQAKVAELELLLKQQQEAVLRAKAEELNIKRRTENEIANARKFALERFVSDLLPVIDSLELGLGMDISAHENNEQVKAYQEGFELTLKMFEDVLLRHHVEKVEPVGEPFDPNLHQAMSIQESLTAEPNSVIAVMQRGYKLSGRLVRPAMVVVSKAPVAQ
jgi:molecular chaperone GrpE